MSERGRLSGVRRLTCLSPRSQTVPQDVVNAVYEIGHLLEQREFLKANDVYLRLAIGNAAWPMGVTMVSVHSAYSLCQSHLASPQTVFRVPLFFC